MGKNSFIRAVGVLVLGVLSGVVGGCAPARPQLSFALEQRILRETTLDDLDAAKASSNDAIVRVMNSGVGACSGALIGPRTVLTAAHCVMRGGKHELTMTNAGHLYVELGGDYLPWGRVGVVGVRACDGYVGDAAHDMAMLTLSQAVPVVEPFGLEDDPKDAPTLAMGGFGSEATPVSIPLTGWSILSLHRHRRQGALLLADSDLVVVQTLGEHGDSGGPIYDPATGRVVSVVSRGSRPESIDRTDLIAGPRFATCKNLL